MVVFPFFPLKQSWVKMIIGPSLHRTSETGRAEGATVTKLLMSGQLIHWERLLAISESAHKLDLVFFSRF